MEADEIRMPGYCLASQSSSSLISGSLQWYFLLSLHFFLCACESLTTTACLCRHGSSCAGVLQPLGEHHAHPPAQVRHHHPQHGRIQPGSPSAGLHLANSGAVLAGHVQHQQGLCSPVQPHEACLHPSPGRTGPWDSSESCLPLPAVGGAQRGLIGNVTDGSAHELAHPASASLHGGLPGAWHLAPACPCTGWRVTPACEKLIRPATGGTGLSTRF